MSRLTKVIEEVKANTQAWIFDKNGNILDDVLIGDIIPWLEELREYEINVKDEFFYHFRSLEGTYNLYTYNYCAKISKDVSIWYRTGCPVAIICVHLHGDAMHNFSDFFAVKMNGIDALNCLLGLESVTQSKVLPYDSDRYVADINIFSETYSLYDTLLQEEVGNFFYDLDMSDLLREMRWRDAEAL